MRVVGGELRGQRIASPAGRSFRPTSDRTREAVFDLLGPGLGGDWVLDLFAGSGALGIEALSRGYGRAVFVESHRSTADLIQANLDRLGLRDKAQVVRAEALKFLVQRTGQPAFDLILLDPPYRQGLLPDVIQALAAGNWLDATGVLVAESEQELSLPENVGALRRMKHKRYGSTCVHLYQVRVVDNSEGVG